MNSPRNDAEVENKAGLSGQDCTRTAVSRPLAAPGNKLYCVHTCWLGFSRSDAERHVVHVHWFVVFVPGSVLLPDSLS